jgi:hypothetical protein
VNRRRLELRDWIGIALIAAFISALTLLFFKLIPEKNGDLIVYMLGQLSGFVATVVGYHYVTGVADAQKVDNTGKLADAMKEQAITARQGPSGNPGDPVSVEVEQ